MGRKYSIPFTAVVSPAAAFDAFEIKSPAVGGYSFIVHEITLGQSSDVGDAAAEGLNLLLKRGVGHTAGSGGTAVTPAPHSSIDPPSVLTATTMNTAQATAGGGTLTTIRAEAMNEQAGYLFLPLGEDRPVFGRGEALIVSVSAPADAITCSGNCIVEEIS
jgi:hypothetical protein